MFPLNLIRCVLLSSVLISLSRAEDCPYGWIKYQSKCYYFAPYTQAYEECNSNCPTYQTGATMLCIESIDQNNFIQNHLPTVSTTAHIGYFRDSFNQFEWFPGCFSTFTNWAYNEPNNADGTEIYAQMYAGEGTWNDYHDGYSTCACEYTLVNPADDDYVPRHNNDDAGTAIDDDDGNVSPAASIGIIVGVTVCIVVCVGFTWYRRYRMLMEGRLGYLSAHGVPQVTPTSTAGGLVPAPYAPPQPYAPQPYAAPPVGGTASAPYPYTAAAPAPFAYPATAPAPYSYTSTAPAPYASASVPYATGTAPYPYGLVTSVPVVAHVEMVPVGSAAYAGYAGAQVVTAESTATVPKF